MSDAKRRLAGLLTGLLFGLPSAVISEYINIWLLPGIPLTGLPVGHLASILATTLVMVLLGLLVAWEKESFRGIIAGSLFIVAAESYLAYLNAGSAEAARTLLLFIFTFLPRTVLYAPVALLLAWAVNQLDAAAAQPAGSGKRAGLALGAVLAAALVVGNFSRLPAEGRQALMDGDQLTRDGMTAAAAGAALPKALEPVEGFSAHARGTYSLSWSDAVDTLNVLRPATTDLVVESLIIVRFEDGYRFGCVYTPPSRFPACINITLVP